MKTENELLEAIDHVRWLLNCGMTNGMIQDNLFLFGAVSHKDVKSVDMAIRFKEKVVEYKLFFDKALYNDINKFYSLRDKFVAKKMGLIDMWRFKRLLKRHSHDLVDDKKVNQSMSIAYECPLDIKAIVNRMIKDYCGPYWSASIEYYDYSTYVEDNHENQSDVQSRDDSSGDKSINS